MKIGGHNLDQSMTISPEEFYDVTIQVYCEPAFVQEYARRLYPIRMEPVRHAIDEFLQHLSMRAHILDIGSGTGKDVDYMRSKGFNAKGIDISDAMLELATKQYGKYFTNCDIRKLSTLNPNSYDGIYSLAAFQHIHRIDLNDVFCSIATLLKPNGIFSFITKVGYGDNWDYRLGHLWKRGTTYFLENELLSVLGMNGFQIQQRERFSLTREGITDNWIYLLSRVNKYNKV